MTIPAAEQYQTISGFYVRSRIARRGIVWVESDGHLTISTGKKSGPSLEAPINQLRISQIFPDFGTGNRQVPPFGHAVRWPKMQDDGS